MSGEVQSAPSNVRLYVVVSARVKEWLDREASEEGLSTSAHVRRRLTRAYAEEHRPHAE